MSGSWLGCSGIVSFWGAIIPCGLIAGVLICLVIGDRAV